MFNRRSTAARRSSVDLYEIQWSFLFWLVGAFVALLFVSQVFAAPFVDSEVRRTIQEKQDFFSAIVVFHTGNEDDWMVYPPRSAENHAAIIYDLQQRFDSQFRFFRKHLSDSGFALTDRYFIPLWIVGGVAMNINEALYDALLENPAVKAIHFDELVSLPITWEVPIEEDEGAFTYGLEKIGVPAIREQYPDLTGTDIVVGVVDTGVDATHPDLVEKVGRFRDFIGGAEDPSVPYDDNNHGTHVSGTIAGSNASGTAIGVAPGVRIAMAKAFSGSGYSSTSVLVESMQWIADPDGDPKTIDDVPHVVNNSWGGSGDASDESPFFTAVNVWRKLQIFPVFSAGNSGPKLGTTGAPALYPISFAVAATDAKDEIAYFSSRGPGKMTVKGREIDVAKPQVAAPGVAVLSSVSGGGYKKYSGTSMAAPHVSGAAALLRQHFPDADVNDIRYLLEISSVDLGDKGFDSAYGHGRFSALKALGSSVPKLAGR